MMGCSGGNVDVGGRDGSRFKVQDSVEGCGDHKDPGGSRVG